MTAVRGTGFPGVPVDRRAGAAGRVPADPEPEGPRLRLVALAWDLAWEAARRLPERVALAVAGGLAMSAYRLDRSARARVGRNLRRVQAHRRRDAGRPAPPGCEELHALVRAAFASYARYWVEAFRAADLDPAELAARTDTDGLEHLDRALDRGRGVIALLAHHGSWDVAARWGEIHGYHLVVVAEVLRPRRVFERFVRSRESMGVEVVPLGRGRLLSRLSQVLADNHLVGLLSDRDLSGSGPVVRLFGEEARLPAGAAVLARRTGAPVVPITMLQRPGGRWRLVVLPALDLAGSSQEQALAATAAAVERLVLLDPAQWHAFQPVWLADQPHGRPAPGPPGTRPRAAGAGEGRA